MAKSSNQPKKIVKTSAKKIVNTTSEQTEVSTERKRPMPSTAKAELHVDALPFTRTNYLLLLAGIGVIVLGFILMVTDSFVDATQFSVPLHIAPWLVIGGFVEIIFAIMYRPKVADPSQETEAV
ncbi:MAG: DUF3098 domain-containing protein [Bacteroidia bacterium]|nr:DUF3098 domain-containing protein [Bacteroidia bacterium]